MKGNEGPNLTGRRGNCAESTKIELLCGNVPAQRRPSMHRNRFAMPSTAVVPSPWIRAQKMCACRKERRGKSPQQAFLSLWTLFAALCCEELLAGCRFLEVGQGRKSRGDAFPLIGTCPLIHPFPNHCQYHCLWFPKLNCLSQCWKINLLSLEMEAMSQP